MEAKVAFATSESEWEGMERFRALFYANARAAGFSDEAIAKLIFQPDRNFFRRPMKGRTVEEALAQRSEDLRDLLPSDLYRNGLVPPRASSPQPSDAGPVTLIIIPGMFGEFIDHTVYEELFAEQTSSFAREWASLASGLVDFDRVFDFNSLKVQQEPLSELFTMASFDDEKGRAQTQVILLNAKRLALETLGSLEESAAIYAQRLNKLFRVLGPRPNIYFMGYSRGLNVGLEILATMSPDDCPWLKDVRGLIGLGGVTYGSPIADLALDKSRPLGRMVGRLLDLADELEIPWDENGMRRTPIILRNSRRWMQALREIHALAKDFPIPEGFAMEAIETGNPDLRPSLRILRDVAFRKFRLHHPFEDYRQNVRRFQLLARKTRKALETIRTENCLAWIKTHRLPEQYVYYAITTTMPDPSTPEKGISPLTANPFAFDARGIDYRALRLVYYLYLDYSGMKTNDAQVSLDRAPFWPELHQLANPEQGPFRAQLLCVLGTDHWGMGFPVAFETAGGKANPFPRTLLLKTLGDFLRH